MLLGPRVRDGTQGYDLVVPLLRSNGSTVLVNRGFISKDVSRDYTPPDAGSEVEITALIRTSQKRNAFTPDNRPADGIWYWVDVDAMAEYAGGSSADVQALCVEEIFGQLAHAVISLPYSSHAFRRSFRRGSVSDRQRFTDWKASSS